MAALADAHLAAYITNPNSESHHMVKTAIKRNSGLVESCRISLLRNLRLARPDK